MTTKYEKISKSQNKAVVVPKYNIIIFITNYDNYYDYLPCGINYKTMNRRK